MMGIVEMGMKETEGKLRWDLLPFGALEEVVRVYTYGAEKYADWNWYKGIPYSKMFAALQRHLVRRWVYGEVRDPESSCHHMASVVFWALAFITFDKEARGIELNDSRQI